ncbi:MAG: acetyl/propionyl/methylcrotonyl-CoA carboxylase subunit alpha [Actinomycetes bacterium]
MFRRVLIANRGEIARRVIRTCRRLGIETVAVHSDVDAREPHVRDADAAVLLGPAPAVDSYLDVAKVVDAAVRSGADAIHPGYGFLSENPALAEACAAAGITFVGPSADVMRLMGDKAAAKARMQAAGVPVVPGIDATELDDDAVAAAAEEVGFPVLIKAVAGGGGKGMRAVHEAAGFADALAAAKREARGAFGDDRVIVEKLVTSPRHVEVQVMGDTHGHVVHVLERECSVQRRHQKVVEETPSVALDEALRAEMGAAAVRAAAEVGYVGAGTVEFILGPDGAFYFLEMNTRLQVEHPVTELVTGLDLVELQLRVAAGQPLGIAQEDVVGSGHAIEVRLYAEDPAGGFLPQTGPVLLFDTPDGPGVRVDAGVATGSEVSRFYDPMLAKLVVHAPDRDTAIDRMTWLTRHTSVLGVTTNLAFLHDVVAHDAFRAGDTTTDFLDTHLPEWQPPATPTSALVAAAVALQTAQEAAGDTSPWGRLGPWRTGAVGGWRLTLEDGETTHRLEVSGGRGRYRVRVDDDEPLDAHVLDADGDLLRLEVGGDDVTARVAVAARDGSDPVRTVWVHADGATRALVVRPATRHVAPGRLAAGAAFASPMPGAVIAVNVAEGDRVTAGQTLVVVEAMKMEHPVTAPTAGTITAVHVAAGDPVEGGAPLLGFEADPEDEDA